MLFRHEKFRKFQDRLFNDMLSALREGKPLLAHAPMGLGKTDAALGAALTVALEEGLTVFFLTPKISQHKIALDVVEGINNKYNLNLRAVDLVGRKYTCIHALGNLDQDNFYTVCKRLREEELCEYYKRALGFTKDVDAKLALERLEDYTIFSHLAMIEYGRKHKLCPYELLLLASKTANVIIADYYHLFIPGIREPLLRKSKKRLENSILIVDEAHNLPNRIRNHLSKSLNDFMLERVDKEAELLGMDKLKLAKPFAKWAKEALGEKKEIVIPKERFDKFLAEHYEGEELVEYLNTLGEEYAKATRRNSFALRVARFFETWEEVSIGEVRILRKLSKGFSIAKRYLDPSIATSIINEAYGSILMSGTLLPLEMYKDVLGIHTAEMKKYPSPFPKTNRLLIITKGLTTRYSQRGDEMYLNYAKKISAIFEASPGGVAVYFPSFEVLMGVEKFISYPKLIQKPSMHPSQLHELLSAFRKSKALLLAVQGGSLAEGVDFSNGEIKVAIIAGLALEDMNAETKALIDYYEEKFGKGWSYGYIYPAITKALQAAGRAIRKETDRAVIVFMDERFSWTNYFSLLPEENYVITPNPEKHVRKFFSS